VDELNVDELMIPAWTQMQKKEQRDKAASSAASTHL
jgi:hypothetical protein